MPRRMMIVGFFLLVFAGASFGQVTLKLPDTTAAPGSSLALPIWVEGFRNVGSISLTITFDKDVMTYIGVSNQPTFGYFNAAPAARANSIGAVALSWFNVTPSLNIGAGKLLDLLFTYKKGKSPLTFANMVPSAVTDSLARNLKATVKNGSVSVRTPAAGKKAPGNRSTSKQGHMV